MIGRKLCIAVGMLILFVFAWRTQAQKNIQPEAREILEAANKARAAVGAGPLTWDPALTIAARGHCLRMASEGPISHRYKNEPDLTTRASEAGAHFSLVEENIAFAPTPARIHDAWMHSQGHRDNLLNPAIDRVGIAVVAGRGNLYAVADYSRGVQQLTTAQIESAVSKLLRPSGLTLRKDATLARQYCASADHINRADNNAPGFLIRWQDADLGQLPDSLLKRMKTGNYREAAVGSCKPMGLEDSFTAYRIAVLLY